MAPDGHGQPKVALGLLCDLHRAVGHRGRPGLVHGARPADHRRGPRRSAARSTTLCRKIRPLAARPGRRVRRPRGDAARARAHRARRARGRRRSSAAGTRGPALGLRSTTGPSSTRSVGGAALAARDPERPAAALRRRRRDRPASRPGRGSSTCPCGGGVALRGLRPGQGVEYVAADISPADARPDPRAAARARRCRPGQRTAGRRRRPAVRRRLVRPGRLLHRAALLPRPGARGASRCAGCSGRAA